MRIVFLGTGCCSPTISRSASSLAVHLDDGSVWLFDCGEGTQVQLQKSSLRVGRISKIFISHLHGDHLFGLPGLMCTLSNQVPEYKTGFVFDLYGPVGLRKYVQGFLDLCREQLTYQFRITELDLFSKQVPDSWKEEGHWPLPPSDSRRLLPNEVPGELVVCDSSQVWSLVNNESVSVEASWVVHQVPCFGFVVKEKRQPGKLDVCKLRELGVSPGRQYGELKKGNSVITDAGIMIHPSDVLGPPKIGRKVIIVGDTSDASAMMQISQDADFVVHEASHRDAYKDRAVSRGHSTASMAVKFAQVIRGKVLVLTHFSRIYSDSGEERLEEIRRDAENAKGPFPYCVYLAQDLKEFDITRKFVMQGAS